MPNCYEWLSEQKRLADMPKPTPKMEDIFQIKGPRAPKTKKSKTKKSSK